MGALGLGSALKPACEPITVARKPISEKNLADNHLKWGVGGINIDGCRVGTDEVGARARSNSESGNTNMLGVNAQTDFQGAPTQGRFPANIIHDGSEEVLAVFPDTKQTRPHDGDGGKLDTRNQGWGFKRMPCSLSDNGGSAARFFYCAKASKQDRAYVS